MTVTQVKALLQELGIAAKKTLGQNFLVSARVIKEILLSVTDLKPQHIIEIGPGLGALTHGLKKLNDSITLIELDRTLAEYWRNLGLQVVEADALKIDWTEIANLEQTILVSNLPYQISSSIVIDRCVEPFNIEWMILMFQKEVAQRIRATHSSHDYGLLSVMAQSYWDIDMVLEAAPGEFFPAPQVASRVLRFQKKEQTPQPAEEFLKLVKASFAQRRKLLSANLANWQKTISKQEWVAMLEGLRVLPTARAEELSVKQYRDLFEVLKTRNK